MNLAYPTSPSAREVQGFGNSNPKMYPGPGRHMGIDIAANVGTPIYAACPGVVETANLKGAHGYGRHVVIEHGDFRTLYAHLHRVFVEEGRTLDAGALIGEMGGDPMDDDPIDGASTGPHLHFELILPAEPKSDFVKTWLGWTVDPFPYLLKRFAPAPIWIGTVVEKSGMKVRVDANSNSTRNILGALSKGTQFEIAELTFPVDATWARVRALRQEWVCVKQRNQVFVELSAPPLSASTQTSPPIGEASNLGGEKAARLDEVNRMIAYLEARKKELM